MSIRTTKVDGLQADLNLALLDVGELVPVHELTTHLEVIDRELDRAQAILLHARTSRIE